MGKRKRGFGWSHQKHHSKKKQFDIKQDSNNHHAASDMKQESGDHHALSDVKQELNIKRESSTPSVLLERVFSPPLRNARNLIICDECIEKFLPQVK
jgi:hypothetical protein